MEELWETDPFACYARVAPDEYDWVGQFHNMAVLAVKDGHVIQRVDTGKVLGLAAYTQELERRLAKADALAEAAEIVAESWVSGTSPVRKQLLMKRIAAYREE